jgi:membrane protease YdiL (CAAX protease family)
MISKLTAILFVLLLVAGVPALSYATARRSQLRQVPRLALYFSATVSQWVLALLGLVVTLWTARDLVAATFRLLPLPAILTWAVALAAVSLAGLGICLLLEHRGWWPKEPELVYLLIPQTPREKLWALCIVTPTAAFCEEFLYRGYLLAQLGQWLHSVPWALGISSLAFGLAHMYQGWRGVLRAALLGALLALPVLRLGSLYPAMLAHALIDGLALVWLGPRLLRQESI